MMPEDELSTETVKKTFLPPGGLATTNLSWFENGGIALQDTSEGLNYQPWKGYWNPEDETVYLVPNLNGIPIPLFSASDVVEFSFAFDQNMRYNVCLLFSSGTLRLYWYDSLTNSYTTTEFVDIQSGALTLDDKRAESTDLGRSDVILSYVKLTGELVFRQQRDRYLIEYPLYTGIKPGQRITNFGMNYGWRLQWRMQFRALVPPTP